MNRSPSIPVPRRALAALALPLLLASAAPPDGAALRSALPRAGRLDLLAEEDGSTAARGASYKASFERGGTSYVPFLGALAPRNFPVRFRLEGVEVGGSDVAFTRDVAARRDDRVVSYDRGSLVELYLTAPDSIEQRFAFDRLDSRGELVLTIAVDTELAAVETEDGFEYRNEFGSVRYGRATAIDASGATCPAPTSLVEGGIRIAVPADFVATARLPLVIDPVISTFWVDDSDDDDFDPDVAYDATNDRYLAVYEEVFSASDHDVIAAVMDGDGTVLVSTFVDTPLGEDWRRPRVANVDAANQFLIVAESGDGIDARTVGIVPLTFGPVIPITALGRNPDVGGDPSATPASYCVVWEFFAGELGYLIEAMVVGTDGSMGSTEHVAFAGAGQPIVTNPSISSSNNNGDEWSVVWERSTSSTNHDIWAARILWDGTISVPAFALDATTNDDRNPVAATETNVSDRWLAAFQRDTINRNIIVRYLDGATTLDGMDLSVAEGNSPVADQFGAAADSDGRSFAVAYTEWTGFPSPDEDVYYASLTPIGDRLVLNEGHRSLSSSNTVDERDVMIVSNEGSDGAPGRFIAIWGVATGGTQLGDVEAGLLDGEDFTSFCSPGLDGVIPCPCANPPSAIGRGCDNSSGTGGAILFQAGTASLANDTVVFTTSGERPSPLSIVAQFTALSPGGLQFGMGVRCAAGTLKRLYTKIASAGSITAPEPGDLSVSARSAQTGDNLIAGSTRYYLVYYRDPNVLGGCAADLTFNATQTGAITWRP